MNGRADMPAIGITPDWTLPPDRPPRYQLNCAYADAVQLAHGVPLVLPFSDRDAVIEAMLEAIDGLLISGGASDIDPAEYGEERRPRCGPAIPERTDFERALLTRALERDLPVLGVCGGMQLVNVVLGGSLHQDLPTEVPQAGVHQQENDRRQPSHAVDVSPGSRLSRAVGEGRLMVNSTHHQAVRRLGEGVVVTARATDGVVEAFEVPKRHFVMGVQWHPEQLVVSVPANVGIYGALVEAARARP